MKALSTVGALYCLVAVVCIPCTEAKREDGELSQNGGDDGRPFGSLVSESVPIGGFYAMRTLKNTRPLSDRVETERLSNLALFSAGHTGEVNHEQSSRMLLSDEEDIENKGKAVKHGKKRRRSKAKREERIAAACGTCMGVKCCVMNVTCRCSSHCRVARLKRECNSAAS